MFDERGQSAAVDERYEVGGGAWELGNRRERGGHMGLGEGGEGIGTASNSCRERVERKGGEKGMQTVFRGEENGRRAVNYNKGLGESATTCRCDPTFWPPIPSPTPFS